MIDQILISFFLFPQSEPWKIFKQTHYHLFQFPRLENLEIVALKLYFESQHRKLLSRRPSRIHLLLYFVLLAALVHLRNALATLESTVSTGCGNIHAVKTSRHQGQGRKHSKLVWTRRPPVHLWPVLLRSTNARCGSVIGLVCSAVGQQSRDPRRNGHEHLSEFNCGTISRRPKRVTKGELGHRAGTTAARGVVILVRCYSWRMTLWGGWTRWVGSCAFSAINTRIIRL